jgi:2-oxoglutarate/2-oxoacid ferredoxin oxidoreductase subunit beta
VDTLTPHLVGVLTRAHAHRGASFVEVFQNCVVFNDGVFDNFTAREVAPEAQLHLEHGKPLLFGKSRERGLRLVPGKLELEVVPSTTPDVLVHDETNRALAQLLAGLEPPAFPVALGVLYCDPAPSFERDVYAQARAAGLSETDPAPSLDSLLRGGQTWTVS